MGPLFIAARTLAVRTVKLAVVLGGLQGCVTAPAAPPLSLSATLLQDSLFPGTTEVPGAQQIFAMSPAMRAYAETELSAVIRQTDPRRALIDALYKSPLRLAYDTSLTRNAAEAFEARAGNCLSLVIMTASFARHLGLPISFQAVQVDDFYTRNGDLVLASGHVNLQLASPPRRLSVSRVDDTTLTVDFMPQDGLRGQRSRPIGADTIVAMYLNNRAAELLVEGHTAQAYPWARAALLTDPAFASAANTLGVIYRRAGHANPAEVAFAHALAIDPDSTGALGNLVRLLDGQGRGAESAPLAARLARLQPEPPFHHFDLGRQALEAGRAAEARDHFLRELRLQPDQHEVHFWAAQAYWQLGQREQAVRHLSQAVQFSVNRSTHDRYAAKLDHLRQQRLQ